MSTESTPTVSDAPTATDALPPVPLTDEQLAPLTEHDAIDDVYVPDGRPDDVYTLAGGHEGDILDFYVETARQFVKFGYQSGPHGLRWERFEPTPKTDAFVVAVREELRENYRRLEVCE
jgi:hypothetical protein